MIKAKVESWDKIFNSIRASTQSDLMDEYGVRLACQWAGNSIAVAEKNYSLVKNCDFDDSGRYKSVAKSAATTPEVAKSAAESASLAEHDNQETPANEEPASLAECGQVVVIVPDGLEPSIVCL